MSGTKLIVQGHRAAPGTAAEPIIFTSLLDSGPKEWGGIIFDGAENGGQKSI